jgi:hypothetical protein
MPAMLAQFDFPRRPAAASRQAVRPGDAHSTRRQAPCGFSRRQNRSMFDPYGKVTVLDGNGTPRTVMHWNQVKSDLLAAQGDNTVLALLQKGLHQQGGVMPESMLVAGTAVVTAPVAVYSATIAAPVLYNAAGYAIYVAQQQAAAMTGYLVAKVGSTLTALGYTALESGVGLSPASVGSVPAGTKKTAGTLTDQAADLVKLNAGKNRVVLHSPSIKMEVDLAGKAHGGVPTPHTKVSPLNPKAPNQPAYNTKNAPFVPATQQDIRTVRRFLGEIGDSMRKNFRIGQSVELVKGNLAFDLHNLYDYVGSFLFGARRLCMYFEPNPQFALGQMPIAVEFHNVEFLEFSPHFGTRDIHDLDEMGYKAPSDRDDNWLLTEEQATSADHLFFRFLGGAFIRVHSECAYLHEGMRLPTINENL